MPGEPRAATRRRDAYHTRLAGASCYSWPTMGNPLRLIGPALLPALLLACSSSGSGNNTTAGTPADLASALAGAFCQKEAACTGTTGSTPDGAVDGAADAAAPTVTTGASLCLGRATLATTQQLALVATAFGEGLLTINPSAETACTMAYQMSLMSLTCATLGSEPDVQAALDLPNCAGLFIGYIPVGERCDMSAECVSGSFCRSQGTGQPATAIAGSGTLGVCFAYQQATDPCNTTADCLPPLTCNPSTLICN
jgi:hypothetical protein